MTKRNERSAAEWATFVVSSLIVLAVVALIASRMLQGNAPPDITARAEVPFREEAGRYYVPVIVENTGEQTAANVQVTVSLTVDGEVVTEGDQVIDFLAGGERDKLVFVVSEDPDSGELDVQVAGYTEP